MSEFQGSRWSLVRRNGDEEMSFGIGGFPGRKSKAFYLVEGNVLDILGYFRSDESAAKAIEVLARFIPARDVRELEQS